MGKYFFKFFKNQSLKKKKKAMAFWVFEKKIRLFANLGFRSVLNLRLRLNNKQNIFNKLILIVLP